MFKSLALSFLISAASSASLLGTPKRLISSNAETYGVYSFSFNESEYSIETRFLNNYGSLTWDSANNVYSKKVQDELERPNISVYLAIDPSGGYGNAEIGFCFDSSEDRENWSNWVFNHMDFSANTNLYGDGGDYTQDESGEYWYYVTFGSDETQDLNFYLEFEIVDPRPRVNPNFQYINCSAEGPYSPSAPRVGDNLEITVLANSDYGLLGNSYTITDGIGYSSVEFVISDPVTQTGLMGKMHFTFYNIAANFSVTFRAAEIWSYEHGYQVGFDDGSTYPTDTAYQNGKEDGEKIGYRNGYEDGKKDYQAGGIWSWFESAANVLASFLDIRLFPSFTIGNLVGAIVGLTIILFFVRAFLFKS